MIHWKSWIWPGVLTVVLLSALALWTKSETIEADLRTKANAALASGGHSWARVEMDGRDATLLGAAPSETDQSDAAEIALAAYDIRVLTNTSGLIPLQKPYIFSARRAGDEVQITGYVPNEATRKTVLDNAKSVISNAKITDNLKLARGAPEKLAAIAGFGFTQLSGVNTGEMSLSDTNLTLTGSAAERSSYNSITAALAGVIPGGAKLVTQDLVAPPAIPYTWSADHDGKDWYWPAIHHQLKWQRNW